MNQILYIDKTREGDTLDIKKVAIISVIVIFIFAFAIIGLGVFGLIRNVNNAKSSQPVVEIKEVDDMAEIKITHDKAIDKIIYSWNSEEETTLQGKGRTEITETIDLPVGNNVLSIKIVDIEKRESTYTKTFFVDDVDTRQPEIELTSDGSKVKIVVRDNRQLEYITYKWNNEDETRVEPREDSKKLIEEKIPVLRGENTLSVTAVDSAGNENTQSQIYKGAKKPKVDVSEDGNEILIKVSDEEEIQKIELTLNGEFFSTDSENTGASLGMQEAEIRQPLIAGENTIEVTVYNVSGLYEKVIKTITKE